MKHHAKEQPGSTFAVDQRTSLQSSEIERRRAHNRTLVVLSKDRSLRTILGSTFQDAGYSVREAVDLDTADQAINTPTPSALVLADGQLGPALWEFCAKQAGGKGGPPMIVLAHDPQDADAARAAGATVCLQLPLPLVDIVACVDQLTSHAATADAARVVNSI
jgi:DNA-binding response OmpR family regulator